MRIDGTHSIGTYAPVAARKRGVRDGGFSIDVKRTSASPVRTHEAAVLSGIESMLALQGIDTPDPRREGMRRGNAMLDLLDELKVALLEGNGGGPRLDRLAALAGESQPPTGDPGLDEAIAAVTLRAKVELAKRGR